MKGQVAFESLFLLLVVISAGIFVTTIYLQTHDGTMATGIARTEFVSLANSMEELVLIKRVSFSKKNNGENLITITTDPSVLDQSDFGENNVEQIREKIINSTNLQNITFQIN